MLTSVSVGLQWTQKIVDMEKHSSSYKDSRLDALTDEKIAKIKKFVKGYIDKMLYKLKKASSSSGNGASSSHAGHSSSNHRKHSASTSKAPSSPSTLNDAGWTPVVMTPSSTLVGTPDSSNAEPVMSVEEVMGMDMDVDMEEDMEPDSDSDSEDGNPETLVLDKDAKTSPAGPPKDADAEMEDTPPTSWKKSLDSPNDHLRPIYSDLDETCSRSRPGPEETQSASDPRRRPPNDGTC